MLVSLFSAACRVKVSVLLYLILPSWFLALDRGCSAMKSSPIATRLVYIYRTHTHRGSVKRRKAHVRLNTLALWKQKSIRVQKRWETGNGQRMQRECIWKLAGVMGRTACADATELCCCENDRSVTVLLGGVKCSVDFGPMSHNADQINAHSCLFERFFIGRW